MPTDRIKPDWTQTTYLTQVDWVHIQTGYKQAGYKQNGYKQAGYTNRLNTHRLDTIILDTKTEYKETRCDRKIGYNVATNILQTNDVTSRARATRPITYLHV